MGRLWEIIQQIEQDLGIDEGQEMERGLYYWTCPRCGAHLDPGEKCDCEREVPEHE